MNPHETPINAINYLNIAAYILNVAATYLIGVGGIGGFPTNTEVSAKYQTLITPVGWAFSIWGVIFTAQLIFVIVQILPSFRSHPLVQRGVNYNYIGVCLMQVAWSLIFGFEVIELSLFFMLMILFFLIKILLDQARVEDENLTAKEFWFLKFPFSVHCGWILAASFVNLSVVLVQQKVGAVPQYYVAMGSLIGVLILATVCLTIPQRSEYVIPLVLAWATTGIFAELSNPTESIQNTFSSNIIEYVRLCAGIAAMIILICVIFKIIISSGWLKNIFGARNGSGTQENQSITDDSVYVRADD